MEMLATKNLAALVVFIGRLMEELGVRHPAEKCVREVAERAHATGPVPKAYKWIMNDLHPYLQPAKPSSSRAPEECKCLHGKDQQLMEKSRGVPKDDLCYAAYKGCLCCVRRLLEERKVNPCHALESQGYSVLDWSLWAERSGVEGADAVTQYILNRWPNTPRKSMMDEPAGSHGNGVCGQKRRAVPPQPPHAKRLAIEAPRPKISPYACSPTPKRSCVPRPSFPALPRAAPYRSCA